MGFLNESVNTAWWDSFQFPTVFPDSSAVSKLGSLEKKQKALRAKLARLQCRLGSARQAVRDIHTPRSLYSAEFTDGVNHVNLDTPLDELNFVGCSADEEIKAAKRAARATLNLNKLMDAITTTSEHLRAVNAALEE